MSDSESNVDANVQTWGRRIYDIQQNRSPEMWNRIRATSHRAARARLASNNIQHLQRANWLSTASNAATLQTFTKNSSPESYSISSEMHAQRSATLLGNVMSFRAQRSMVQNNASTSLESNESHEIDSSGVENLTQMEQDVMAELQLSPQFATPATVSDTNGGAVMMLDSVTIAVEVDALLASLASEPTDSEELVAKFKLFENILATVTAIRNETIEFWRENKDQFSGEALQAGERDIHAIDSPDTMGLSDHEYAGSKWFVYYMTKKANTNNIMISKILANIRAQLELLSNDLGECPICLDELTVESALTLSCCHRVCRTCWQHWKQLKVSVGAQPFCPLCKHEEFVVDVMQTFSRA